MNKTDAERHDELHKIIEGYCEKVRAEFNERMSRWPFDFEQNQVREVVGALVSRQAILAQQMACSPAMWSGHIVPLILRAMADVHITLVWILASPAKRARAFVLYGLGQQKLELEHRKAQMVVREPKKGEIDCVKAVENWINRQRAEFLTEVNLGSWSGKNTREMASEVGCLDFYNYVYSPFSSCVHSMWHHVSRYNLEECKNPLHGLHRVPKIISLYPDPHYLYLAAKYLRKSFAAFDSKFGVKPSMPSAYTWLCETIEGEAGENEEG